MLDALDSTTAACSAWGSSTTDPGLLTNETTRLAPSLMEAQSDDGAASWGQTWATLAMFIVYGPSAEWVIQATSPGGTANGVAPAMRLEPGPVGGGLASPTVGPPPGSRERPTRSPTTRTARMPARVGNRARGPFRRTVSPARAARSRSSATDVRAQRSRGGSGIGSERRSARSSA